ncbi:hypothetical protein M5K25_003900 [Dendrobium thyrsiflorum]|uniref:Uncharacterized protein n=1 Tax=Dendrobium thyrsiflorum TaxID=117978 RepID=A0ABD0VLR7_DENTH
MTMNPIKISWFCCPRGYSRPNFTDGSLSTAMGYFVQGYLVDLGRMLPCRNLVVSFDSKTTRSKGPNHNCLLVVLFDGKTTG